MEGIVSWPQLAFLSTVVITVAGFMFVLAWRTQELRAKERHDQRTAFQQEIVSVHELIKMVQRDLDSRLRAIEMSNAGALVVLEHMKEFRSEIVKRFETLERQRHSDMELLHRRLDAVHNAARMITVDNPGGS